MLQERGSAAALASSFVLTALTSGAAGRPRTRSMQVGLSAVLSLGSPMGAHIFLVNLWSKESSSHEYSHLSELLSHGICNFRRASRYQLHLEYIFRILF